MHKFTATTIATVVTAAAGLFAAGSAEAAGWQYHDLDRDGISDTAALDSNGDGAVDQIYRDADQNRTWDVYLYVTGNWVYFKDLRTQAAMWRYQYSNGALYDYIDLAGDGRYELEAYDGNGDGRYDYEKIDTNGDGVADGNWRIVPAPVNTTTTNRSASTTALELYLNQMMIDANNRMIDVWLS